MKNALEKIGFLLYCDKEQKVLLHFRDGNTRQSPYHWDLFGGAIEGNETPDEALVRELFEELRLSVRTGEKRLICEFNDCNFYCINFPFDKSGEIILGEGGGLGWLTLECALNVEKLTDEAKRVLVEFKKSLCNIQL